MHDVYSGWRASCMATVIEAIPFGGEHRLEFHAKDPVGPHVVFSGFADCLEVLGKSDDADEDYEVHLVIGPFWTSDDPQTVVPYVTIVGFSNTDADEDDSQNWSLHGLRWTTDKKGAPPGSARIRLEFTINVRGEHSNVYRLEYHVTARGRSKLPQGLGSPGPVLGKK